MIFPNNQKIKKSKSIVLYVLHLPILLLLLGFLGISTFISTKASADKGSVLSSGSSNDDDEDEDKDEDKNDDEDSDDNDSDEDEDSDDNDNDNNNKDEDNDEDDNKDEIENELEIEDESDDDFIASTKQKSEEKVQNADGTYSIVKKEIEGDKIKIESKTYNSFGKLVKEEKSESSDEGIETESEDSDGNKLKVRVENSKVLIKSEGTKGLTNFPLFLDEADGNVYVQTPKGEVMLGVMPQTILDKIALSDDVATVSEIEIESEENDDSSEDMKLEYKVNAKKSEKLFGVINLELPSVAYYDTQTGDLLRTDKTIITKILDFFSF